MATANAINANTAGLVRYDGAGVFDGVTVTDHNLLVGASANGITSLALTSGQLAIGSTGADPVAATLTAGTGLSIVNAAGSVTLSVTGMGASWSTVAGTSQAMAVNNGYIPQNASLTTFSLPASASVGQFIGIAGVGAGGFSVSQGSGQSIVVGQLTSSTGVGGSVSSTKVTDVLILMCIVANTTFKAVIFDGNFTVV